MTAQVRGLAGDGYADLEARLKERIKDLCRDLLGEPNFTGGHDWRYGRKESLKVEVEGADQGKWFSFEERRGGGPIQLIAFSCDLDDGEARQWAVDWLGVDVGGDAAPPPIRKKANSAERLAKEKERRDFAKTLIAECQPIEGTLAEVYLHHRGINPQQWPKAVLFHPGGGDQRGQCQHHPALLLVVTDTKGTATAVHRVFLSPEGRKADVRPQKRSDGVLKGSAVRLPAFADDGTLILAEGGETALAIWSATGLETWAMLGSFRDIEVPSDRRVVVAADDDAEDSPARKQLETVLNALRGRGIDVRLAIPFEPSRGQGEDFNDLLQEAGADAVRDQISAASKWTADMETEAALLANLPLLEYEKIRVAEAQRLGVRVQVLDKEVRRIRGSTSAAGAQGIGPLSFDEPVPWPEPIAPDVLLDDLGCATKLAQPQNGRRIWKRKPPSSRTSLSSNTKRYA